MADLRILLLAMLFGTGSWIAMTGLWLEMPLFIQKLPEGWSLASHMNIMIQLANIGPFLYWILEKRYKMVNDINAIHLQMWLGIVSCLFLIGFWNRTSELFGQQKSIFLLIFTFFLAFTDCTSSVTFLPFMARFSSSYLPAYLVGEGLSSFLPSLTALIQGSGHSNHRNDCLDVKKINETESRINFTNSSLIIDSDESTTIDNPMIIKPRFSIEIFLCSLLLTLSISYGAFLGLRFFSFARKEQQTHQERINQHNLREIANTSRLKRKTRMSEDLNSDVETRPPVIDKSLPLSSSDDWIYYLFLGQMFLNCFLTLGFMPPLQPFSSLPYGPDVLHFVVILSAISYPIGCFSGMLFEKRSIRFVTSLTLLVIAIAIYIITDSLGQQGPPLVETAWNDWHPWSIIFVWVLFIGIGSYSRTMITLIICDHKGRRGMFWTGMNTQIGSTLGGFLIFILINYFKIFNQCDLD